MYNFNKAAFDKLIDESEKEKEVEVEEELEEEEVLSSLILLQL